MMTMLTTKKKIERYGVRVLYETGGAGLLQVVTLCVCVCNEIIPLSF